MQRQPSIARKNFDTLSTPGISAITQHGECRYSSIPTSSVDTSEAYSPILLSQFQSITSSSPLTGKVALLPGASQGIGAGIALEFARRHASLIILIGRNEVLLKGVKEQAEEIGGGETKVEYIVADLSLTRKVKEALMQVVEILDGKKIDYIIETQG